MLRSSSFLNLTVWTPEIAFTTVDLPCATCPMVPGCAASTRMIKVKLDGHEDCDTLQRNIDFIRMGAGPQRHVMHFGGHCQMLLQPIRPPDFHGSFQLGRAAAPMLMVACLDITSGDNGVSCATSKVAKFCGSPVEAVNFPRRFPLPAVSGTAKSPGTQNNFL
jgi:hypothetical protein